MEKIKLGDVCKIITKGTTPTTIGEKFSDCGKINYVKSESLTDDKYLNSSIFEHITEKTHEKLKRSQLKENDLLFSIAGAYLGKIGVVRNCDLPLNTNQAVGIVRIDETKADYNYIYYFFSQPVIKNYIKSLSAQSAQPNINLELLSNLTFTNFNLEMQKKISSVLSILDEKIFINKKINATLEAMAKTLYDYWFVQFDFPDENGKPYKSSGGKTIFNAELGREIPEGWQVGKLSEFGNLKNGINYDKNTIGDALIKIVNVKDISASSLAIAIESLENIKLPSKQIKKYLTSDEDILIARSGIPGAVRILAGKNVPVIYCGFIICLKLFDKSYKNYLIFNLQKNYEIILTQSAGTIMQNVTQETLKKLQLAMPPATILKNFNLIINQIISEMQKNLLENFKLSELRDFLLPLLMNGQVGFKE